MPVRVSRKQKRDYLDDKQLLKGRVPQPDDWVKAWAECTEKIAFRKQERLEGKREGESLPNFRRLRRKQIRIMAEARRMDIRQELSEATAITLAMDDRKYQKLIRYRCDAPNEPFVRRGILCVMGLGKSAVGDFEEDHALVAVRKLERALNTFSVPNKKRGEQEQVLFALKEHIRKTVKVFAVDGASKERRALTLASKELLPNVILLLRDPAHALKIAVKDPLHYDTVFGEIWEELFNKRHGLVPDVMNSSKWQDLLQHIQKAVLRIPMNDRPLAVVLKHLRFAKHRFDSSADPMAKVAYMLLPLATLLSFIASDERHQRPARERAKQLLKKLSSKFALGIGVCADWGLVCQAFLRLFDTTKHDIALTYREIQAFKDVLRIMFDRGAVFTCRDMPGNIQRPERLPAIGGYYGIKGVKPEFVTHTVENTLQHRVVFNCGQEQLLLWGQKSGGRTGDPRALEVCHRARYSNRSAHSAGPKILRTRDLQGCFFLLTM